jgi:hypothetical protein
MKMMTLINLRLSVKNDLKTNKDASERKRMEKKKKQKELEKGKTQTMRDNHSK